MRCPYTQVVILGKSGQLPFADDPTGVAEVVVALRHLSLLRCTSLQKRDTSQVVVDRLRLRIF
jgi:hypothetical protein